MAALAIAGCEGSGLVLEPALETNHETVNLCRKEPGVSFTWQNLQLRNAGSGDLTISGIAVRGDSSCAFRLYREPADSETRDRLYPVPDEESAAPPLTMTVPPGNTRLVRIDYTPTGPGVIDRATLVIRSDASDGASDGTSESLLEIPICGVGIGGEESAAADAGADPCPDCGEPLSMGAPGCDSDRPVP